METREMNDESGSLADRAAGHRALAAMTLVVVALLISCVAMMLVDWRSPRPVSVKPAPTETLEATTPPQ